MNILNYVLYMCTYTYIYYDKIIIFYGKSKKVFVFVLHVFWLAESESEASPNKLNQTKSNPTKPNLTKRDLTWFSANYQALSDYWGSSLKNW